MKQHRLMVNPRRGIKNRLMNKTPNQKRKWYFDAATEIVHIQLNHNTVY